jgi:DNA-binding transcriptional ArsR family regulator
MPKVTLDKDTFKALASETRLEILKTLDGTKMNLTDLCTKTNLNKATLHEHLNKLIETGIVKKIQRPGHKWVYYTLTWKGESLLHPENTKIVIIFSISFITLITAIVQIYLWVKSAVISYTDDITNGSIPPYSLTEDSAINESINQSIRDGGQLLNEDPMLLTKGLSDTTIIYQNPVYLILAVICFILFGIFITFAVYKLWKGRVPQL